MKTLLVVGCSHSAGCEIDGNFDSEYNRSMSFGGRLADMLGMKLCNISLSGSSNSTITRHTLEWLTQNSNLNDIFVLIGWTDPTRIELPMHEKFKNSLLTYKKVGWTSPSSNFFVQITPGSQGSNKEESQLINYYKEFMSNNIPYFEIQTMENVLQLQYFFESKNIKYLMCNTMYTFSEFNYLDSFKPLVNTNKYFKPFDNDNSFYWKYRNLGYKNENAKYWHHGKTAHLKYAEELLEFIETMY